MHLRTIKMLSSSFSVIQIPLNRPLQPILKLCLRQPSQLPMDFGRINGVTQIMPLTVFHKDNQVFRFPKLMTDQSHDIDVSHLIVTADIVDLSDTPLMQNQINRPAVIVHIEPVTDI